GRLHFWLSFIFFNLTFGPMHFVGIDGMPRRVADYAHQFATWNAIISVSAFIFGASFFIFLYNIITSWRFGPQAEANPWRAHTLASPPASGAGSPPPRRSSTSTRSPPSWAAPTSTASRGRCTACSRSPRPSWPAAASIRPWSLNERRRVEDGSRRRERDGRRA